MFLINTISEYIKNLRSEKKLSIRKAAELTGISHTELINIEKGIRLKPSLTTLKKLSYGLNIPFENLMNLCEYDKNIDLDQLPKVDMYNKNKQYPASFLEKKILDKLTLEFKNINSIFPEFKLSSNKKLDYLIYTDTKLIAVEFKHARNFSNLSYLQIKSLFLDFYFNFKDTHTDEQLKFMLILFYDSDVDVKIINKIDKEFKHLRPILDYKIYTNKDL